MRYRPPTVRGELLLRWSQGLAVAPEEREEGALDRAGGAGQGPPGGVGRSGVRRRRGAGVANRRTEPEEDCGGREGVLARPRRCSDGT
ncbi:hypothetical protein ACRAWF_35580 [Streptomyces sp. L7]